MAIYLLYLSHFDKKKKIKKSLDQYLVSSSGGHSCSLLFLCLLRDWPSISESWEGIQGSQSGHVCPCFHPTAVLLLCRLAEGETDPCFTCAKYIFFSILSRKSAPFPLYRWGSWSSTRLVRMMTTLKPISWLTETLRLSLQDISTIWALEKPVSHFKL